MPSDAVKKFLEKVKGVASGGEVAGLATNIKPLSDPNQVLDLLIDAITYVQTDPRQVRVAVNQTIHHYQNKFAVFSMAIANTQLRRIFKMIQSLDRLEEGLNERRDGMSDDNLIRAYSAMQTTLLKSLDYIKQVSEIKLSIEDARNISQEIDEISEDSELEDLKLLTPQKRNRIRQIIDILKSNSGEDTSGLQ